VFHEHNHNGLTSQEFRKSGPVGLNTTGVGALPQELGDKGSSAPTTHASVNSSLIQLAQEQMGSEEIFLVLLSWQKRC
jgi:hypothetical protein